LLPRFEHVRVGDRGEALDLPVASVIASAPGPVVVITGNVHGDEYTGVTAAHSLIDRLLADLVRGAVHVYPSLNPGGLRSGNRGVGSNGHDLNRRFPGSRTSDLASRHALAIWEDLVARSPDLLIDLHADSAQSIPYAIVDRAVRKRGAERADMDARLRAHAEATGLTVLHEYPDDLYLRFGLDRSLAGATVNHLGVPAVTIEAGPRRVVNMAAVRVMVDAVLGVLAYAGLVQSAPEPDPTRQTGGPWRRTAGPRTAKAGVFEPALAPGSLFERGDLLGRVRALRGEVVESVRAPTVGIVVSWADACWVEPGTVVATIGVPEAS
jgi:predicted deacylase